MQKSYEDHRINLESCWNTNPPGAFMMLFLFSLIIYNERCGVFSIQNFILQILETFNRAFWSWNLYKIVISGFRVCYFQQLYCITIVLHLYLEIMCMHFILSSHHISSHICNHICHKKLQCNFPKIRGLGSKAVWNFSKDSSDLVAGPFP